MRRACAQMRTPHGEVRFILEFAHEEANFDGREGYALATFKCAIEAISRLEVSRGGQRARHEALGHAVLSAEVSRGVTVPSSLTRTAVADRALARGRA